MSDNLEIVKSVVRLKKAIKNTSRELEFISTTDNENLFNNIEKFFDNCVKYEKHANIFYDNREVKILLFKGSNDELLKMIAEIKHKEGM